MADIAKLVDQLSELTVLEAADLAKALAALPSLDELRATIVGLIQAPATKIARTVSEPGAQLARVFAAYGAKEAA
jgi:large subunit ribosomal protein L10